MLLVCADCKREVPEEDMSHQTVWGKDVTVKVDSELAYAKGMVSRRQNVVESLGLEGSSAEAVGAYRSLAGCLREVLKHHNNVMSMVNDATAGAALESSLLVDSCRAWLEMSARSCMSFGISEDVLAGIRREVRV